MTTAFTLPTAPCLESGAPAFTIEPITFEQLCHREYTRISFRVHGYWSSDSISVYLERHLYWAREADGDKVLRTWKFTVSHASGGRDSKVEPDDAVSAKCFGLAMIAAAEICETLKALTPELEATAVRRSEERAAAEAARKAAEQAAIDADVALGEEAAKTLVKQLWMRAELDGSASASFYLRGSTTNGRSIEVCKARHSGVITARFNGSRCSRNDLPAKLADLSARRVDTTAA